MLKKILSELESGSQVSEEQAGYGIEENEDRLRIEDLSPELQESIRQGLADADAGEVHSQEEEEKYWAKWFKEK